MISLPAHARAFYDRSVLTEALCWSLEPVNASFPKVGFTDIDRHISFEGTVYVAGGISPTASQVDSRMSVDSQDFAGFLEQLDEADIQAGVYDEAFFEVFALDYTDIAAGRLITFGTGWLGKIAMRDLEYVASVEFLTVALQHEVGRTVSPVCMHDLGRVVDGARDDGCGVILSYDTLTVDGVTDTGEFTATHPQADDYYTFGRLTWNAGAGNEHLRVMVREQTGHTFKLLTPMRRPIQIGDTFDVHRGCDKRRSTCRDVFDNIPNRDAFDFLPEPDRVAETAGA